MQKLKCELCGSIDIIKTNDDLFQCQSCGCKYTLTQAQSLIEGVVETTIGNAELKRLIANAETQIKLAQNDAFSTIDTIIREYPNDYNGYWLYIKATIQIIQSNNNINLGCKQYNTKYGIENISLKRCKELYSNFLKLSENRQDIPRQQIIDYWETSFQNIYNGLINGKIKGCYEVVDSSEFDVHPLLQKAKQLGKSNCELLLQNNIYINFIGTWNDMRYCMIDFSNTNTNNYPCFILGKDIFFGGGLHGIIPPKYSPFNEHIAELIRDIDRKYMRCPKCHVKMNVPLLSNKYKCPKCGGKY